MTIESNNPNKPKMLFYDIYAAGVETTHFKERKDSPTDSGSMGIKTYKYLVSTNDEIAEDKFKEIKMAIHKILNGN